MLSKYLLITCFILCAGFSIAQVSNNNIKDRTELFLNATPLQSTTRHSSVEWNCINKQLTNKCLVYHNDQWFHFRPEHDGDFFLNVSSQQCRDLRGIQVIIIEGNPCEINTYRILQCIPKIHQDDVFIELDSLRSGIQYLVNIDGFLGDFCEFDIQFSSTPEGFSRVMNNLDTLNMQTFLKDSAVTIRWSVHESVAEEVESFKVYRLNDEEGKSILLQEFPLRANALGDYGKEYELKDLLRKQGKYKYRIFGVQKETQYPLLLDEQQVSFFIRRNNTSQEESEWVYLPLNFKNGERYQVMVFNRTDYSLLRKYTGEFDSEKDSTFEINLNEFVSTGVKEFIILASEVNSNQAKEFYFQYDGKKIIGN